MYPTRQQTNTPMNAPSLWLTTRQSLSVLMEHFPPYGNLTVRMGTYVPEGVWASE